MELIELNDDQQKVVEDNIALVHYVAGKYRHVPKEVYDSIVSRLHYRLCVCAQRFDPARHLKISSYIVKSLKGEIKNYFRDESWIIRPPRPLREMSFSSAVDSIGDELSAAELRGENPQTIGSCAIPVPLHTVSGGAREEDDYELDIASDENIEREVTDRLGGKVIVQEVFQALRLEERIILTLQMKRRPIKELEERFQLTRQEAGRAWAETKKKAQALYRAAIEGRPLPISDGNEALKRAMRRRYKPETIGYLEVRERVAT